MGQMNDPPRVPAVDKFYDDTFEYIADLRSGSKI